ncbi:MAG: GC-type dockerin domain-anchored protein [Phycisphaerales bacterium]|nr:GC-type dockerin domain-anchored protein [Phycisphaerales bacterium]
MNSTKYKISNILAVSIFLTLSSTAMSGDYEIPWSKISNGGAVHPSDGEYTIKGTIGLFAPGQMGNSTGYSISGGFLPGTESTSNCLADLNNDGVLNFFDVSAYLTGFIEMDPGSDFTGDGVFNFFDVSAFLAAFSQGCP